MDIQYLGASAIIIIILLPNHKYFHASV